ncbi:MAG: hypothetical protein Q9224_005292, partial [Gallowayella concinna]
STYIYAAAAAIVRASAASTGDDTTHWVTQYETECFTETSGRATSTGTVVATYCPHCTDGASPGGPGSPGSPSPPKGPLTTYTTVYSEFCSTGLQPKTYTVTEECSSPGTPRAPDYVPSAFVVTTATCHVCGEKPVVAAITTPAPVAPSAGPAAPAGPPAPAGPAAPAAPAGSAPVPAPAAPAVGGSSPAAPASPGPGANPPAGPDVASPPSAGPVANPPAAPDAASPPSPPGSGPSAGPAAKAPYSPLATGAAGAPVSPDSPIVPFTGSASSLVPASFIVMITAMIGAFAIALKLWLSDSPTLSYTLSVLMYTPPMQRPPQQRNAASDSTLSKLKLWFNKGSEIQSDHKASHQAIQDQQRNMGSTRYTTERNVHNVDGAVRRPATVSPLGPRQLPQAVHAEVRNDRYEGDQVSIFSSPQSTPPSSLTSAQSHNPLAQMPRRKPSKANPRGLQISLPQPRQSLLNLASNYADVQNPEKKQPTPAAQVKSPLYKKNEQRSQEYRMEQPIKEVTKGQGQVMATPSHQRSQKAVVRKMAPQQTPKTDSHVRRETRFEDFMGKDSPPPPLPALSANTASLAPSTSTAFRLSRPFAESSEYDHHPTEDDDARPGTASTAALSRSDSRAQTWLRYDRQHGETIHQQRANNPPSLLVSRRNMTVPDRDQQFKEYTPCQSCRRQVHPSAAVSYNGVYECEDCAAAAAPKKQQHPKAGNLIIPRKPVPETPTPRTAFFADNYTPKYSTLSSSTTLRNTPSPQLSPRQSRPRNTDIPPG